MNVLLRRETGQARPRLRRLGQALVACAIAVGVLTLTPLAGADDGTGTWSATASVARSLPRYNAAAAPLAVGKAMFVGGYNGCCFGSVNWVDIYDASGGGSFSNAASLPGNRQVLAVTPLGQGKVLAAGGLESYGGFGPVYATAYVYDFTTGGWSPTGSMSAPRYGAVAAPIDSSGSGVFGDGDALVIGGSDSSSSGVATVELYHEGSFTTKAPLPQALAQPAAASLGDGRVLVAGGSHGGVTQNGAYIYDPFSNTWSTAAPMTAGRTAGVAFPLGGGRVLVAGGTACTPGCTTLSSSEVYDATSDSWSPGSSLGNPRGSFGGAALGDGQLVAAGGIVNGTESLTAILYTPSPDAPPQVTLSGPAAANEGTIGSYTFDTIDPDSDSFTLDESTCGASASIVTGSVVFTATTGDGSFGCAFADDNPTATPPNTSVVGVTVGDEAASGSDTLEVIVSNVAPSALVTSPSSGALVPAGSTPMTATFTDPGKADTHTCTINGGSGTVAYTPAGSGTGTCTGTVALAPGANTIEVEVCDDDSGCDAASVTVSALYAIYAHETCSGGAGKGIIVNGDNADIDGPLSANGNLKLGGTNFQSGAVTLFRPQSGCSTSYSPSQVNFGGSTTFGSVGLQSWPWDVGTSELTCTKPVKDEYIFNTSGQTIPAGVYCANKVFKINASNITGNITVIAPEIVLNGKNINLSPFEDGVLLRGTSTKEIVVDSDFTADTTATLAGLIHNPAGGVKINGQAVRMNRGFIQGQWVEINLKGFRMQY